MHRVGQSGLFSPSLGAHKRFPTHWEVVKGMLDDASL